MSLSDFERVLVDKQALRRYSVLASYRVGRDYRVRTIARGHSVNDGRALIDTLQKRERSRFIRRGRQYSSWTARVFILQLEMQPSV